MYGDLLNLLVATSVVLAAIVSARCAYVMGLRWGVSKDASLGFLMIVSAGAAALLAGFATYAAILWGGLWVGLFADLATLPVVGAAWIFVVGGNKAVERIIAGLLNTVDAA